MGDTESNSAIDTLDLKVPFEKLRTGFNSFTFAPKMIVVFRSVTEIVEDVELSFL